MRAFTYCFFLITIFCTLTFCTSSKEVTEEKSDTKRSMPQLAPLTLTPELQAQKYQIKSDHALSLVNEETGMALDATIPKGGLEENALHVQFKAMIDGTVLRFEADIIPMQNVPNRWLGRDDDLTMILRHFPDSLYHGEQHNNQMGQQQVKMLNQREEILDQYFEVQLVNRGKTDTIKLPFWSRFYVDYELHGNWEFSVYPKEGWAANQYKDVPFIQIEIPTMKLQGFDGCNRIFGQVFQSGKRLDFSRLGGTKRFCSDINDLMQILGKVTEYEVQGDELKLIIKPGEELVFRKVGG
ncbi:MAG: META domain-containing protein [Cryomorphaceae bacterium]|nr:META domain-containing protein [Cryomorphaceae bacterium]